MMKEYTLFVVFSCVFVIATCDDKCKEGHLYEDLGCKPITKEGSACPVEYKCENLEAKPDSCNFKSKSYKLGEKIDDDLIYPSCNVACTCNHAVTKGKFTCAILDCPEWLGVPVKFGCYRKYDLGKCCSTGQICPPFDESAKCEVEGKTHQEGNKFYPKDTCLNCVCKKGFKGVYDENFCQKQTCAVELRHSDDLENNCAPVYFDDTHCCPDGWVCPKSDDKIEVVNAKADGASSLRCKFGEKSLKLGEGLKTEYDHWDKKKKVECECKIPPFLTCVGAK